jgi:hypothetical protein
MRPRIVGRPLSIVLAIILITEQRGNGLVQIRGGHRLNFHFLLISFSNTVKNKKPLPSEELSDKRGEFVMDF